MFVIFYKKWNKLASSSINQNVKSQKQCLHPRILLLWQKVWVKRHQHRFTFALNKLTLRRQYWDEFYIQTLVWHHTKSTWFRSWSQLTIRCVFSSLSAPEVDLQKMPVWTKKKSSFHLFLWKLTIKIVAFGAQKIHKYTLKSLRNQNESLLAADFGSKA